MLAQFCFIAHPGTLSLFFHLRRCSTLAVSPAHVISQRVHLGTQVFLISNQPTLKASPVFSPALPDCSWFKCAKQTLSWQIIYCRAYLSLTYLLASNSLPGSAYLLPASPWLLLLCPIQASRLSGCSARP